MLKEFKAFVMRGNVLDLAVGVIIGAAFGKIVSSLVDDILMPPIGRALGHVDFSNLFINLSETPYNSLADAKKAGAATLKLRSTRARSMASPFRSARSMTSPRQNGIGNGCSHYSASSLRFVRSVFAGTRSDRAKLAA